MLMGVSWGYADVGRDGGPMVVVVVMAVTVLGGMLVDSWESDTASVHDVWIAMCFGLDWGRAVSKGIELEGAFAQLSY
jgi:hypothetical protein